jgi:nucleotide-binding universal stress UspA family protein
MELTKVDIKHILYTTDFSENARYAFAYATCIANQFSAKLTLLHVVQEHLLDLLIFDVGAERSSSVPKRLSIEKEHFQKAKETVIEKAKTEYGWAGVDSHDILVEKGNPVQLILRVSEERNCDFIVMGIKGRGVLEDSVMGDTVRRVLRRSKNPVLVVQHPEEI